VERTRSITAGIIATAVETVITGSVIVSIDTSFQRIAAVISADIGIITILMS
jgi:hypothetical protein